MFRTVRLSIIIRSFPLYTRQWYMSYRLQLQLARRIRTELRPDTARKLSARTHLNIDIGLNVSCHLRAQAAPLPDKISHYPMG